MELLSLLGLLFDVLNILIGLADMYVAIRDLSNYLSKRKRAAYTLRQFLFWYAIICVSLFIYAAIAHQSIYDITIAQAVVFPVLYAFFVTIIVTMLKTEKLRGRVNRKNFNKKKNNK